MRVHGFHSEPDVEAQAILILQDKKLKENAGQSSSYSNQISFVSLGLDGQDG